MTRHVVKLPDLGEGTVSSEIVAWHIKIGERVEEDQPMVELSTDKAVVEMPVPVSGRVLSLGGQPGDHIAVGAELVVLQTADEDGTASGGNDAPHEAVPPASGASAVLPGGASIVLPGGASTPSAQPAPANESAPAVADNHDDAQDAARHAAQPPRTTGRIMASPATRRQARESGIDLATITGTGRDGRIQRHDLEAALSERSHAMAQAPGVAHHVPQSSWMPQRRTATEEIRILGVRRVSAQRVAESKRNIPHFAYVEEVDVTELERLRRHLNSNLPKGAAGYTYLPLLAMALVRVIERFPKCNAQYDAERNILIRHSGIHLGVATQTADGLKVPVVQHVEALSFKDVAAEIRRVTEAARQGTASRNELRGSTITITSLGKLGGIVSTPIINAPEVAVIGVNKAVERPVIHNGNVAVRLMMNLSSSFDHRFIDGYDAAETIQALKEYLEQPATIFIRQ